MTHKKSFWESLTGGSHVETEGEKETAIRQQNESEWMEESNEEGQLSVDVYQNSNNIIIKAITAGVRPDNLDVEITPGMVTIRGERQNAERVEKDNYFYQELYWGTFSRTILLPQEIDPDESDAVSKNGVLVITLPKLDKQKVQKLRIKSE